MSIEEINNNLIEEVISLREQLINKNTYIRELKKKIEIKRR